MIPFLGSGKVESTYVDFLSIALDVIGIDRQ